MIDIKYAKINVIKRLIDNKYKCIPPVNKNKNLIITLTFFTIYNFDVKIEDNSETTSSNFFLYNYDNIILIFFYNIDEKMCFKFNRDEFIKLVIVFKDIIELEKKQIKSKKKKNVKGKYKMLYLSIKELCKENIKISNTNQIVLSLK